MKKKIVAVLIIVIVFVFFGKGFYKNYISKCDFFEKEFAGEITATNYTTQKLISVKIDNNWYYLGTNITYDINVEKGDSIFKNKSEFDIYLKKGNEVYNISSRKNVSYLLKFCPSNEKKE